MPRMTRRALWNPGMPGRTAGARADQTETLGFLPPVSGRGVMRRRYFPNVSLTTHLGTRVRFYDDLLKDKIVVLNMMYADCSGVCPRITANLVRSHTLLPARVDHDVYFYSMTVRPEEDTPEKLRDYAAM